MGSLPSLHSLWTCRSPRSGGPPPVGAAVLLRRVQLPHPGPQFRGNPRQPQPGVEGGFVGEVFHLPGLDVGDSVFVQGQPHAVGEVAQADVVLLAAGEVLQHRADGIGLAGAEVNLESRLDNHARLARAVDQHFAHLGKTGQAAAQFFGPRSDGHQVNVADGFLPTAQAARRGQQRNIRVAVAQGGHDRLGGGHASPMGVRPPMLAGGLDVAQDAVGGPLAHAGQRGKASVGGCLLHALDRADAQFSADEHGGLGADAGDCQQVQRALRHFGLSPLVGLHLAGGHQLVNLVADGLADARYAGQLLPVLNGLGQRNGKLVDGIRSPPVGANLERRVALHFQQGAQVLEQLGDFVVGGLHFPQIPMLSDLWEGQT